VAAIVFDADTGTRFIVTKDTLQNQLHRDGPIIRKSFDKLSAAHVAECSAVLGGAHALIIRNLGRGDTGYKTTAARLIWYALRTYMASIEVARHGYRRPYGVLARSVLETIATVVSIAIHPGTLEKFHAGTLQSTKCITSAKAVFPPLGSYYRMLSEEFVHIGKQHGALEELSYSSDDPALPFILGTLRANAWMIYVVAELVFFDNLTQPRYWVPLSGGRLAYAPSESERAWMAEFLQAADDDAYAAP
jgi:hypothetical protein